MRDADCITACKQAGHHALGKVRKLTCLPKTPDSFLPYEHLSTPHAAFEFLQLRQILLFNNVKFFLTVLAG